MDATEAASKLVQSFVEKSIQAAYKRVSLTINGNHPWSNALFLHMHFINKHLGAHIDLSAYLFFDDQVLDLLHIKSKTEQKHPLAILANELKLIVEKDANVFIPILSLHFPQVIMHSSRILHQLYGEQLVRFINSIGVHKFIWHNLVWSQLTKDWFYHL